MLRTTGIYFIILGYDTCKMFPSGRKTGDHSFPLAKCIRQR